MLELVEASFSSLNLGMDKHLDPGPREVPLDLLKTVVLDTGGETLNIYLYVLL